MFQSKIVPASPFVEWIRTEGGRRAVGLGLTLLIEALLLLVLLTLGTERRPGEEETRTTVVSIRAEEVAQETPETPEPEQQTEEQPRRPRPEPEEPRPPQPAEPQVQPAAPTPPPAIVPMDWQLRQPNPLRNTERPAAPARPVYGPPDTRSAAMRDSERVGTAPNGEPLYAAEWYREPDAAMLRAYLSGARGPGWGLIACRTVDDFRVEDCVGLSEYPEGSNMNRSVLAAAWEFRVRPPRRGGRPLVGSWVRIRIDYRIGRP